MAARLKRQEERRAADNRFAKYFSDPVGFAREVLDVEPWSRQIEILESVRDFPKTAVRSGHKIGKSNAAAMIALWWVCTRVRALIVMTSSTDEQIKNILWPEVSRLYRQTKVPIGGMFHTAHRSGLVFPDGRRVIGISTNKTDNMGGFSGAELLFIADEASGIEEEIFDAIEGNRAGGAKLVMFGNPIRMSGRFFRAFHSGRAFWHCLHVSSAETPNVIAGRVVIPGLATKEWVDEKTRELGGPGDPEWDVRVGGNFPTKGTNSIITLELTERAVKGHVEPAPTDGLLEYGVDVARFGDDETVIQPRRGKRTYPKIVLRSMDGFEVAGAVVESVRALRIPADAAAGRPAEKPRVKIDAIGVGSSAFDALVHNFSDECTALPVNAGESPSDESFEKLRDQLWFAVRDWLRDGGTFAGDELLEQELIAPTYGFGPRGRIKVESKDETKKKLEPKRSPDRADALALAVFNPPQAFVGSLTVDWMSR